VLAAAAVAVLACDYAYYTRGHPQSHHPRVGLILAQAALAATGLAYGWWARERLRVGPLLVLAAAFPLLRAASHLHIGILTDSDPPIFGAEGHVLLHGHYPRSEYPPGGVLLFALEDWLDPRHPATPNQLLMIPFQVGCVAAIWSLRTRLSAWLAAVVALWPLNAYYWEFKYDLVPAALLAAGLALALRRRWGLAGVALGIGTAAKWTPALAFVGLAVWCLAGRSTRAAGRLTAGFVAAMAVLNLPFLAWAPGAVAAAYTRQGGRSITAESVWYLPLRWSGLTEPFRSIPLPAGAPRWADVLAVAVQATLVLGTIASVWLVRANLPLGVAVAGLAPVVFLLTNRIFSPQFLVPILVAWAVALALVRVANREALLLTAAALVATTANAFVFPFVLPGPRDLWQVSSAVLFVLAFLVTGRLLAVALSPRNSHP
jgi:glycosyl transferase family 87